MMLLDTHALIWLSEGNPKLGRESISLLDKSLKANELFISSISFWEVAMLIEKERISLSTSVDLWRKSLLGNGLREIPLTGDVFIHAALLLNFHGDPADRIITATALKSVMTLCTADKKILNWENPLIRVNAKK